jgi:uncharacterized protein (TIGR03067 family)
VAAAWGGDDAAVKKELKRLEGTWEQLEVIESGKKTVTPEGVQLWAIIRGNTYRVEGCGKVFAEGTLKLDPSKKPPPIDFTRTRGESKGETFLAVYELKGDLLRICVALPGNARPTAVTASEGSGLTLQTFRHVRPKS